MNKLILVPRPKEWEIREGRYTVSSDVKRAVDEYTLEKVVPAGIHVQTDETLNETFQDRESYRLSISSGQIEIAAKEYMGVFHALQTLRQIFRQAENGAVPCMVIRDWPDYTNRGVMIDISRDRVPTMETLYRLIDMWTELKYNQLQLYTEHTFAYSGHKRVWEHASPLTGEEVQKISAYCGARGMELIPNQNSFGHMERWLQHKEYRYLAEAPEGFVDPWGFFRPVPSTLSPAVPAVTDFLSGLYDELLPNFKSDLFNVGGDETYELGQGRSKELCEARGLEQVYVDFIRRLHTLAGQRGKRTMVYADILMKYPHMVEQIPSDIILLEWGYEADHPFEEECRRIAEAGKEFYICPGTSAWNSIGGRWENARQNIGNAAVQGLRYGASGFLLTEWGDNGHRQQYPVPVPAYFLGASAAWNLSGAEHFDPVSALTIHFFKSKSTAAAETLMLLQDVYRNERMLLPNASIQAVLLLDHTGPYFEAAFPHFQGYDFSRELSLLDLAEERMDTAGDSTEALFADEILLTLRLLRHACSYGRLRFATPHLKMEEIERDRRKDLAGELSPLIDEYSRLWKQRCRIGGLQESAGSLQALRDLYLV